MSKGNQIVPVRLDRETFETILGIVQRADTRDEPWTVSSWIRKAIADKLSHMARSRAKGRRAPTPPRAAQIAGSIPPDKPQ